MKTISIVIGSTRENRRSIKVGKWVYEKCLTLNKDISFEILDIKEYNLVHYNEPGSPKSGREYTYKETRNWSEAVKKSDGFIFVTPEYNGFITGALKDAIDYLYHEWTYKPYGIVGYGSRGAKRATYYLEILLNAFHMKKADEMIEVHRVWDAFIEDRLEEDYVVGNIMKMIEQIIA